MKTIEFVKITSTRAVGIQLYVFCQWKIVPDLSSRNLCNEVDGYSFCGSVSLGKSTLLALAFAVSVLACKGEEQIAKEEGLNLQLCTVTTVMLWA